MIKIYEIDDVVELHDDVDVPHNLGAETVRLVRKLSPPMWSVSKTNNRSNKIYIMDEQWFL